MKRRVVNYWKDVRPGDLVMNSHGGMFLVVRVSAEEESPWSVMWIDMRWDHPDVHESSWMLPEHPLGPWTLLS